MLDLITTIVTGGAGGLAGVLGSAFSAWMKQRQIREERVFKKEMFSLELEARAAGHQMDMESNQQQISGQGLVASIKADAAIPASGWASSIKALFRPFLTTCLLAASVYIFIALLGALGGEANILAEHFSQQELVGMLRYTVYTLIFSTATAVTWWFGDRAMAPPSMK